MRLPAHRGGRGGDERRERVQLRWPGSAMLLAQRWEEGWDRPLTEWREKLGIAALVARSPFRAETPRV